MHNPPQSVRRGDDSPLCQAFLLGAGRPSRAAGLDLRAAEHSLVEHLQDAQRQWPTLQLDAPSFMVYLGDRLARDEHVLNQVLDALQQSSLPPFVSATELYLACACATGQPGAVEAFEGRYGETIASLARRFSRAHYPPEDLAQALRAKLFVRPPNRPPRIAEYRGVGHLDNWLRVTATRAFLDELRCAKHSEREHPSSEEAVLEQLEGEDWELRFLKERYRGAFRQAFTEALEALPTQDRNLLRFHTIGGLSIDQLAGQYGIHRSNVARRLARVRDGLFRQTRAALMTLLRINSEEFESIMGLIQSQLDVSLARLLATRFPPAGGETT